VVTEDENLLALATMYYKNLFGPSVGNMFEIDAGLWMDEENESNLENEELTKAFTEYEIKNSTLSYGKNKVAGPDGFPIEFYQTCWDLIKDDMMVLFNDFYLGVLDIQRLNYGVITLLPKIKEVEKMQ
jgi:hypothetical protein